MASLIQLMEAGTAPWRREWDSAGGGHHVNLISGRPYRGSNPVLLTLGMHLRGSCLPWWCGFAEAKARGLHPRRGCRAVHVLRPLRIPAPENGVADAEGSGGSTSGSNSDRQMQPARQGGIRFKPVAVFNAADLEGETLNSLVAERRRAAAQATRPEPERLQRAEAVLRAWPVAVRHGGDRACYLPSLDRIELPDRDAFHSAPALYATWAHEAIHSTGHPSRLGRDLSGSPSAGDAALKSYAREELVAELGAVLLGDRLEIGSDGMNHAAYLGHWVALLRESPRLLLQVLGEARRAADLIAPERQAEAALDSRLNGELPA